MQPLRMADCLKLLEMLNEREYEFVELHNGCRALVFVPTVADITLSTVRGRVDPLKLFSWTVVINAQFRSPKGVEDMPFRDYSRIMDVLGRLSQSTVDENSTHA